MSPNHDHEHLHCNLEKTITNKKGIVFGASLKRFTILQLFGSHGLFTSRAPKMSEDTLDVFDENWPVAEKIWSSVKVRRLFDSEASALIESKIDQIVQDADNGAFKPCTVDRAPLRNK